MFCGMRLGRVLGSRAWAVCELQALHFRGALLGFVPWAAPWKLHNPRWRYICLRETSATFISAEWDAMRLLLSTMSIASSRSCMIYISWKICYAFVHIKQFLHCKRLWRVKNERENFDVFSFKVASEDCLASCPLGTYPNHSSNACIACHPFCLSRYLLVGIMVQVAIFDCILSWIQIYLWYLQKHFILKPAYYTQISMTLNNNIS